MFKSVFGLFNKEDCDLALSFVYEFQFLRHNRSSSVVCETNKYVKQEDTSTNRDIIVVFKGIDRDVF
jgi:hypothetical protein